MHADERPEHQSRSAQIIIHEFRVGELKTSGSLSSSAIPRTSVDQVSSRLVKDATREAGWKSKRIDSQITLTPLTLKSNACFLWAPKPPHVQRRDSSRLTGLKLWGDPFLEEECIDVGGLNEFQHAVDVNESTSRHVAKKRRIEPAGGNSNVPAGKRRKLFFGSLHGIIAQPYYHSSASGTIMRGQIVQTPPYKKSPPVTIPPYNTVITLSLHPLSAYARTAWIIPVRGILPWSACTQAVVLDDDEEDVGAEGTWIQWTKAALVEFWAFLVNVRATGKMGQIGISFHLASARERELSADAVNEQYSNPAYRNSEIHVWSRPLSCADYVKIYHEASNAMCLRNILDAWGYGCLGKKVRVLKGSKLALVDECCRGLLVS